VTDGALIEGGCGEEGKVVFTLIFNLGVPLRLVDIAI
jgi:hypothetical protein